MFSSSKTSNYILASLLCFLFVTSPLASEARREIPVNSGRSVRQQVDTFAELLTKEASVAKNNRERFRILNRVEDEIVALRDNSLQQTKQDEAYMDLILDVLDSIPDEKDFHKKDCAKYESDMLNQFEPTADEAPTEPAVKPGWDFLQALCNNGE